jgi:hypothetical protein
VPELLRLRAWDLLCQWTGRPAERVEPRLALHLVNESALCLCSQRSRRTLSQKGFELANGLPFVPTDGAIHDLLDARSIQQSQQLQIALGKLRRAGNHFAARLLAFDAHRTVSYSKRQMRRHRFDPRQKARKMAQTFFLLDCETMQPVCFSLASSATTATQAAEEVLGLGAQIFDLRPGQEPKPLVLADKEHHSHQLFESVHQARLFDLLVAVPAKKRSAADLAALARLAFTEQWPGYATAHRPHTFQSAPSLALVEFLQRSGGRSGDFCYQSFLGTSLRDEVDSLTKDYPSRWHIEEFFKFNQALGWDRAGTLNLNVRYGHMSLALLAQAAIHQLRERLGQPVRDWDALHLAQQFFTALEGDVRVEGDTIVVTLYNAPNVELLRRHYEGLPAILGREGVEPEVPWLYGFKLDFRFK